MLVITAIQLKIEPNPIPQNCVSKIGASVNLREF